MREDAMHDDKAAEDVTPSMRYMHFVRRCILLIVK